MTDWDIVSKQLGQYMLKGYTLLDTVCATCSKTPLMRLRNEPEFCVLCDSPEKKQEKQREQQLKQEEEKVPAATPQQNASEPGEGVTDMACDDQGIAESTTSLVTNSTVYGRLVGQLEQLIERELPLPTDHTCDSALARVERALQLIQLTKKTAQ
ncbi:Sjogren's syndrome/scleroderma autoantigen 1 family protein [Schizosaccharomyces japonicus yFS275]|uniref:Sjogren's syndrome/scleroderma autoantigen 1 family protein n=1 Tax=Schizosaccharomyces japonicus (strain yFS275 / FY16936) TaxID=402676 RepID=B6JZ82_SCHJY|nr:Sjogren's syndrome/scleroderma autoantigen 1 family protein [Schizosaccharomyces japonicus yFS275]EEB06850.1 Sjogren's syndrome/scleroderma autoantigen 1 family protein [Schizosaccharomyces japonicus yFS275]